MKTENAIAGHGHYTHEVPSEVGRVVLMRDGSHEGTEVYQIDSGEFRFVSLDSGGVSTVDRCVLVRLTGVSIDDVQEPYACDLESPDGLALIGCGLGDQLPGEILWDSATRK